MNAGLTSALSYVGKEAEVAKQYSVGLTILFELNCVKRVAYAGGFILI